MQNITELREKLIKNYELVESKQRSIAMGKALAVTAGRIISSCMLEYEYNKTIGNNRKIDFLEPCK